MPNGDATVGNDLKVIGKSTFQNYLQFDKTNIADSENIIQVETASTSNAGGNMKIIAGKSGSAGGTLVGGNLTLNGGAATGSGDGGSVTLGAGTSSTGNAGNLTITGYDVTLTADNDITSTFGGSSTITATGDYEVTVADGKTLTLGNADKDAYFKIEAHGTDASEDVKIVNTNGTDAAAIQITATAGGVDIDAAAAKVVNVAGGQVALVSKDNAASAISLTTNQGSSETIVVTNTKGEGDGDDDDPAIKIDAQAGGILMKAKKGI